MIQFNEEQTIVSFGHGDMAMGLGTASKIKDGEKGKEIKLLGIYNLDKKYEVGQEIEQGPKTTFESDVVIGFENDSDIDNLIRKLTQLRDYKMGE